MLVQACGDAIIAFDDQSQILTWSPAAERLFGHAASDVIGRSVRQIMPAVDDHTWHRLLSDEDGGGSPQIVATQCRRPDGTLADTEFVFSAVRDARGTRLGFVGVARDISRQTQAETAANELVAHYRAAVEALEQADARKSDFIATISHEFRTPLTSIQGFSELLATEPLSPDEVRAFGQTINQSAVRLRRMIDDLLDLDALEVGHQPISPTLLNLNGLVERVLAALQPIADQHWFVTDFDPTLPDVKGDADLLERVVTNIVANAIKYSPQGGPITITTATRHDGVELTVADLGIGVPAEYREVIFSRYGRIDRPQQQGIDGTGLGLPIARHILELHNGRVWVEPNVPRGSVFRVVLPVSGVRPG